MGDGLPHGAVGPSVAVLIYSFFCLTCSTLVVGLLLRFGEKWTYVTLLCTFAVISTVASIIQQFHYAFAWEVVKEAELHKALQSFTMPALGFRGAAQVVDVVLYDIQFYCYNVMALNELSWSVALFFGSWEIKLQWLGNWHGRVSPISKIFSILFPTIIIGLSHAPTLLHTTAGFFVAVNITMLASLLFGSVLLVLILYKYMKTRRLLVGMGRWWASGNQKGCQNDRNTLADRTMESELPSSWRKSIYDRDLVTRFTVGYVILAILDAVIIGFSTFQQKNSRAIAESGAIDHSVANAVSDILFFIPGVTASLVVFLVFGTTKSWKQYRDLVIGGCCSRTKTCERCIQRIEEHPDERLEFQRLRSLPRIKSEGRAVRVVENFVPSESQELMEQNTAPAIGTSEFPISSINRSRQFSSPSFMAHATPGYSLPNPNSTTIHGGHTRTYSQDEVIQYGPVDGRRRPEANTNRAQDGTRSILEY